MEEILKNFVDKHNYKVATLNASRLSGIESDLKGLLENGLIDEVFNIYFSGFSFNKSDNLNSIIILAIPNPQHRLKVHYKEKLFDVIIPPHYSNLKKMNEDAEKQLIKLFAEKGFNITSTYLPYKLLAARSGLAKYGRNNISYIEDWGSFYHLVSFYSDWKASKDNWQEFKMLDACKKCNLCLEQCPTGAITPNSFILDTPKCLTYLNESIDDIPDWVSPKIHNSLVGCMKCQDACPYNKKIKNWIVDIGEINEEETTLLLNNQINDPILIKKLKDIGLYEWIGLFPFGRNLRLLIDKSN